MADLAADLITLRVPSGRASCADWLRDRLPAEVADLLELTRSVAQVAHASRASVDLDVAILEVRQTVLAQCERQARAREEHFESELAVRDAQLKSATADLSRTRDELGRGAEAAARQLREARDAAAAELEAARTDLEELRRERATFETSARERADARVAEMRGDYEARLQQQRQLFDEFADRSGAAHAEELRRLERVLDEQRAQASGVEALVASLCGTSQKRGELGERFVRHVHDAMNLGTLSDNAHQRAAGYADGTWSYQPPGAERAISALVEIKFAATGDSEKDVAKFHRDLDVAVRAGRANAAVYFSLLDRVGGKAVLDLEIVHGVPVLWASRGAADELSAGSLVQLAFNAFATAWPLMCGRDAGSDATLQSVASLLAAQMDEYAKLEPRIAFLERTGDQMRREAGLLRKTRDALVAKVANFQGRHPALCAAAEMGSEAADGAETLEASTLQAIRAHHARRGGYYPKTTQDLSRELDEAQLSKLSNRPEVFELCVRKVRAEKQMGKKRPRAPAVDVVVEGEA